MLAATFLNGYSGVNVRLSHAASEELAVPHRAKVNALTKSQWSRLQGEDCVTIGRVLLLTCTVD